MKRRDANKEARLTPRDVDRLVNTVLDLEADGRLHEARKLSKHAGRVSGSFEGDLARTRGAVGELQLVPAAPDFTDSILDRVEDERPFLARPARRRVSHLRLAGAAFCLLVFGGYAVVQRVAPQVQMGVVEPAPVSEFVDAGRADLRATMTGIGSAFAGLKRGVLGGGSGGKSLTGFESLGDDRRGFERLGLGDTSRYEAGAVRRPQGFEGEGPSGASLVIMDIGADGYASVRYEDAASGPGAMADDGRAVMGEASGAADGPVSALGVEPWRAGTMLEAAGNGGLEGRRAWWMPLVRPRVVVP